MGCHHDDGGTKSPCNPETEEGNYNIMAPYVHLATTQWSTCSKKFMDTLFEYASIGVCD